MFVRLTYFSISAENASAVKQIYTEEIAPVIRRQPGIKEVMFLAPADTESEYISCSVWEAESDVKAFEGSESYHEVFAKIRSITTKPPHQKYYTAS